MADYYPLIARAVEGLADTSPETRRAVYERARTALVAQLRSIDPPLSDRDIENERASLDDAIIRVEADFAAPLSEIDQSACIHDRCDAVGSCPLRKHGASAD